MEKGKAVPKNGGLLAREVMPEAWRGGGGGESACLDVVSWLRVIY